MQLLAKPVERPIVIAALPHSNVLLPKESHRYYILITQRKCISI